MTDISRDRVACAFDLLALIRAALNRTSFEARDGFDWWAVYRLAVKSSVEGAAWVGAEGNPDHMPEELQQRWMSDADAVLWKSLQFDVEREKIIEGLERGGLAYLPLKGLVFRDCYPDPRMRSMCDNDILYGFVTEDPNGGYCIAGEDDASRQSSVRRATKKLDVLMQSLGYEAKALGEENADCFQKEPIFNFEMHRVLAVGYHDWEWYYVNPWHRAIRNPKSKLSFTFSHEDAYIYHVVHTKKHFEAGGCGLRCLVDQQAITNAWGESLNWDYVHREIETLEMSEFECRMRLLSEHTLGESAFESYSQLSRDELFMLDFMSRSGVYGTAETRIENSLNRIRAESSNKATSPKGRYLRNRILLTEEQLKFYHPFVYKHRILTPILVAGRLGKAFMNTPRVLREVRALFFHGNRSGK